MKSKKGFTLIELIVVIAILATLTAIALPSYTGLKRNADLEVCQANRITFKRSYMAYTANKHTKREALELAAADVGGTVNDDNSYTDKSGHVCTITYDAQSGFISTVDCSEHGEDKGVTH